MSQVAPIARLGEKIPGHLLDALNERIYLDPLDAAKAAHPLALCIAASHVECNAINHMMTRKLVGEGALSFTIYAHHKPSRALATAAHSPAHLEILRASAAATISGDSRKVNSGTGMGPNKLTVCIGSRVRAKKNELTSKGLFQGAMGTVVAFGFPRIAAGENAVIRHQQMIQKYKNLKSVKDAAKLNMLPPLIFVQLDHAAEGGVFESCLPGLEGVVCFPPVQQEQNVDGFQRFMPNLMPAHAITYHKCQGLTCKNGVIMMPPSANFLGQSLPYVGISRCTQTDGPTGLLLLSALTQKHFDFSPGNKQMIEDEYARLRALPGMALLVLPLPGPRAQMADAAAPATAPLSAASLAAAGASLLLAFERDVAAQRALAEGGNAQGGDGGTASSGGGGGDGSSSSSALASVLRDGVAGITNLGNTCYIATVLQCLMAVPALRVYFSAGEAQRDVKAGTTQEFGHWHAHKNT